MIIQDMLDKIGASGWNTYRGEITDLQGGNRGRDSQTMGGLLDNKNLILKDAKGETKHSH